MSDIEVTVTWNDNLPAIIDGAVVEGLNKAGAHLQKTMRDNFGRAAVGYQLSNVTTQAFRYRRDRGTGNWATRSDGRRKRFKSQRNKYAASAPGDFPAIRTGRLRNSIGMIRAKRGAMVVTVGTNLRYGRWLERGWMSHGQAVHARPWCLRTFYEERQRLIAILRTEAGKIVTAKLGGGK